MRGKSHNRRNNKLTALLAVILIAAMLIAGCGGPSAGPAGENPENTAAAEAGSDGQVAEEAGEVTTAEIVEEIPVLRRASFLPGNAETPSGTEVEPSVEPYTVDEDLGNVFDIERYSWLLQNSELKEHLAKNGFVVDRSYADSEFFPIYEINRYGMNPNFVTVDSLMHTYHLAFALILRKTEKDYLYEELKSLSESMFYESLFQYETVKGTSWENAAAMNVMYFAVGASLLGLDMEVPSQLKSIVDEEYGRIMDASAAIPSDILTVLLDYTQFQPRGYYEGDPITEAYFRAMMWYGLAGFPLKNEDGSTEDLTRAAVLMTLALDGSRLEAWEKIYTVTSFFAGASDDISYYEMLPLIEHIYGDPVYVSQLPDEEEKWNTFYDLTASMRPPAINSMVTLNDDQDEVQREFRFMGQRYTVDAEIFQSLLYPEVGEKEDGARRMLPDTLDVAAAMGSDTAVSVLEEQKDTGYPGYMEQVEMLRDKFGNEEDPVWSASLSASWLNTLNPLFREKGEGYPFFMQGREWAKKSLETFAGSYAELKHDTVLYAKQAMAEMGGGPIDFDDRGYVEPEPEVYARFISLSKNTAEGLKGYGMLSAENEDSLSILTELGEQLLTISNKELANETLTDEEYELIRTYGGIIEHFWKDFAVEITGEEYVQTSEFPAMTIIDIATDLDSLTVQEIGVGGVSEIYVLVPVDGTIRIASGAVYNFYQFEQPMSERLTDSEWKGMVDTVEQPAWTQSYSMKTAR